ncbi:hypothetical protein PAPYR_8135 [Paratrimastix pyriformis]|uniref:DNA2/NAM7 helicase helicase domain-containing protein n=1 Tax=Paratrimastix pyriformis TaxID=342808 RepID=A0ABQ8UIC8_9EUKA|nr:hypothetical protein PAPYR_8135 [Paratrimastix pyriformis]
MFHFYLCAGAPLMLLVPLGTDAKAISPLPVVLSIKLVRVSIHNTVWRTTGAPGMSDGGSIKCPTGSLYPAVKVMEQPPTDPPEKTGVPVSPSTILFPCESIKPQWRGIALDVAATLMTQNARFQSFPVPICFADTMMITLDPELLYIIRKANVEQCFVREEPVTTQFGSLYFFESVRVEGAALSDGHIDTAVSLPEIPKGVELSDEVGHFDVDLLSMTPSIVAAWAEHPPSFPTIPLVFRDSYEYYSATFYRPLLDEATAQIYQALHPDVNSDGEATRELLTLTDVMLTPPDPRADAAIIPLVRCEAIIDPSQLPAAQRLLPSDLLVLRLSLRGDAGPVWMGLSEGTIAGNPLHLRIMCLSVPEVRQILDTANPSLSVEITCVTNFGPMRRVGRALRIAPHVSFMETLLTGRPSGSRGRSLNYATQRSIQEAVARFGLNDSQQTALEAVLDGNGISLVQGPPGTGKTHTVDAIISCMTTKLGGRGCLLVTAQTHIAVHNVLASFYRSVDAPTGHAPLS